MEGMKTLRPPGGNMSREKRHQKHSKSSYNGPSSTGKLLQLTPLWEQVLRNQTVPPEIDKERLFSELGIRLQDLEWEVRQHALRFLIDLIPVIDTAELDSYVSPVVLPELTANLGHPAPAVRKGALDTLKVYLSKSPDPERAFRVVISEGLEKQTTPNAIRGNVAMGVILSIPALLSPLLSRNNGVIMMSQEGLIHLMYALSKKLVQITYQEQALRTLIKIRDMVGEGRFNRFLEGFHPQCKRDFDILCHVYDVRPTVVDSGIDVHTPPGPEESLIKDNAVDVEENGSMLPPGMNRIDQNQNHIKTESERRSGWGRRRESEDESQDTVESLEQQPSDQQEYGLEVAEERNQQIGDEDAQSETSSSYQDVEESEISAVTVIEEAGDELINSGRVIIETEIKFNEGEAIMMTIMEEGDKPTPAEDTYFPVEANSPENVNQEEENEERPVYSNDYIVKVLTDEGEEYDEEGDGGEELEDGTRRTPRRVRFGSEMVKMRTPDSDEGSIQQGGQNDDASTISGYEDEGGSIAGEETESFAVLGATSPEVETQENTFEAAKSEEENSFQLIETQTNVDASSEPGSIQKNVDSIKENVYQAGGESHMNGSAFAVIDSQTVETTDERVIVSTEHCQENTFEILDNESETYEQESVVSFNEDNQEYVAENEDVQSVQGSQDNNAFTIIDSEAQENAFEIADSVLDEASEIPENESYIPDNASDFQDSVSEYQDNASDMPDNASDFTEIASDYPDNATDYQDNVSEIPDNVSDIPENAYYFQEGSISPQESTIDLETNADYAESNLESPNENNAFHIIDAGVQETADIQEATQGGENAFQIVEEQRNDEYIEQDVYVKTDSVCTQDVIYANEGQNEETFIETQEESRENFAEQMQPDQEQFITADVGDHNHDAQMGEVMSELNQDKIPVDNRSQDIVDSTNGHIEVTQQGNAFHVIDAIQDNLEAPDESVPESADDSTRGSIETVIENHDYTAEVIQASENAESETMEQEASEPMPPSHIPLPIAPARSKPKDHKKRSGFRRKSRSSGTSTDSHTENSVDNAESAPTSVPIPVETKATEGSTQEETEDSGDGKGAEFVSVGQNWEDFGIVSQSVLDDLHDTDNWLRRMRGVENLVAMLRLPDILQSVIPCLPSLLHTLLVTLGDDPNYRVAVCALSGVRLIIQALPAPLLMAHLPQLVAGLARHVGGSASVNLKIEAVQAAKILMQMVRPSPVAFCLLTSNCIGAKSSKMRENSILLLTYATLTFPSTEFLWDDMAGRVVNAVGDPRRRVRQAALESLAVFAQFTTPSTLDVAVKSAAERQSTHATRDAFLAGIQARLARRALPTVSPDGLILYALQIPASRCNNRGGIPLTPSGADVEWVVAGSGSLSSGSAKSRAQLIAAQRLDPQPGAVSAPAGSTPTVVVPDVNETSKAPTLKGNPWTVRRALVSVDTKVIPPYNRSHSAGQNKSSWSLMPIMGGKLPPDEQRPRGGGSPWTADAVDSGRGAALASSTGFSVLPSKLAAVSISGEASQEKLNQTWPPPSTAHHSPRVLTPTQHRGRRILEPLNSSNPGGSSEAFVRRRSPARVGVNSGGRTKIPPLSSSPKRYKDRVVDSGQHAPYVDGSEDIIDFTKFRSRSRSEGLVERSPSKHGKRRSRNRAVKVLHDPVRAQSQKTSVLEDMGGKTSTPVIPITPPPKSSQSQSPPLLRNESPSIHADSISEDCTILQKPMLARQAVRHELPSSFHSDSSATQSNNGLFMPPVEPFLPPVDLSNSHLPRATPPVSDTQQQDELEFKSIDENDMPEESFETVLQEDPSPIQQLFQSMEAEERAYKYQLLKEQENHNSISTPTPAVVNDKSSIITSTEIIDLNGNGISVPSTPQKMEQSISEENNNERKSVPLIAPSTTGSIIDLHLDVEDATVNSNIAPIKRTKRIKRTPASNKGPIRAVRGIIPRDNRNQQLSLFPESLRPVDKPKEAMQQCFAQMDSGEWEVTMQGLQLLVRLMRYHPDTIHHHLHSVIVALGKQVRNLRSQVARAACQACAELFVSQKRAVETDLDEIAAPLLHKTADTNRFLRTDSNTALDKMVENISPSRAVSVIICKGTSHQNAVVRTSCARLLVNIVKHLGVDKVMTYPGEMKDKILLTGANLLTEGSLDTRCLAKELFRLLSKHPSFLRTMNDVIPSQLLRNISKTLQNLK